MIIDPIISDIRLCAGQPFCLRLPGAYAVDEHPDWMRWLASERHLTGQAPYLIDAPRVWTLQLSEQGSDYGALGEMRVMVEARRDTAVYIGEISALAALRISPDFCPPGPAVARQYALDIHPGQWQLKCINAEFRGQRISSSRLFLTTTTSKRHRLFLQSPAPARGITLIVSNTRDTNSPHP